MIVLNKKLEIKELKPYLYLLDEAHESTGYLLIGEDKACLIDTMMGYNDLYQAVRSITDKPLIVINTHGHPDHIYGNVYFDKAYMNPADREVAKIFTESPDFVAECKKRDLQMPPFEDIHEGDVIDLGGRTLKVYQLPGHTPGGILLLFPEDRILFTGDTINHHVWMQLPGCLSLGQFAQELERLMFLEGEADFILHGHARDYDDISLMSAVLNGVREIIAGKTEADKPYRWFGGTDLQHPFEVDPDAHFQQDNHVICYREDNIRRK